MSQATVDTTKLAIACPFWSKADWDAFDQMSPGDQELVMRGLVQSKTPPSLDMLEVALEAFKIAGTVVGVVTGVTGGVAAIQGAIDLIKKA